jgi:signal peptidase I
MSKTKPQKSEAPSGEGENIRETLQSILIAFVLAFVFRSFVVEAFVIPTGSMAPTLLGKHIRAQGETSGYNFAVNPATYVSNRRDVPQRTQSTDLVDPMSGETIKVRNSHTRSGDRILVLKYLYLFFDPERFDVVVFKNPTRPAQNYIKRLIGLPGEEVWLVDGDVFSRRPEAEDEAARRWQIQRKPRHVQQAVWQPVFHSDYQPLNGTENGVPWFQSPWRDIAGDWEIADRRSYRCLSPGPATIVFEPPGGVTDYTPFDQTQLGDRRKQERNLLLYAVSDLRIAAGVKPDQAGLRSTISLRARGHAFEAVLTADEVLIRMRGQGEQAWTTLGSAKTRFGRPGRVTNVEFWHVDQAVSLWVNGKRVVYAEYDWSPSERFAHATGESIEALESAESRGVKNALGLPRFQPEPPQLSWSFDGSPFELFRVAVDRDLHYRPAGYGAGSRASMDRYSPGMATHPGNVAKLGGEEFFVLGDNSAMSLDGRLWQSPDPWVAYRIDDTQGVVHRKLMLGKAFFVYWPSMQPFKEGSRPIVPDFGRMRFIR